MQAKYNVGVWTEENKNQFLPPVCNKLMYKKQLSVMFVGGPNTRTDFHVEEGSEFFYQMRGDMELPTVQAGKRKLVKIREGEVFLLPSRIPHAPQRPVPNSLGLVVERDRTLDETDCLRWYQDFQVCDKILWQKFFHCDDLGKDLVPVVGAFKASDAFKNNVPDATTIPENPPLVQDMTTTIPDPFPLIDWLQQHQQQLFEGKVLNLFPGHPDKEFLIEISGGGKDKEHEHPCKEPTLETWLYQLRGKGSVTLSPGNEKAVQEVMNEGDCGIILPGTKYTLRQQPNSITMCLVQNPLGNKRTH